MGQHPNCVMILMKKAGSGTPDLKPNQARWIVRAEYNVGDVLRKLREFLNIGPEQAIFVFAAGRMLPVTWSIQEVYEKFPSEDGFLHLTYGIENTFGNKE